MDVIHNVNQMVKVRLTDYGVSILKDNHDGLNQRLKERGAYGDLGKFELKLDDDGYYETQMWDLMNVFGEYMRMGMKNPFHLDIKLIDAKEVIKCNQ